jgi:hypothetical protein
MAKAKISKSEKAYEAAQRSKGGLEFGDYSGGIKREWFRNGEIDVDGKVYRKSNSSKSYSPTLGGKKKTKTKGDKKKTAKKKA